MERSIILELNYLAYIVLSASLTQIIEMYGCEYASESEVVIRIPDAEHLVIVGRRLFNNWFTRIEPVAMRTENLSVNHKMTLGSYNSPMQLRMWNSFRNNLKGKASICTCTMPGIVQSVLFYYYNVKDRSLVFEMTRKLLPFGTKHFGVKEFEAPTGESATLPWSWTTPYSICYTPEELEAICELCYEIIRDEKSINKIRTYDINLFKESLREKTKGIKPSLDIVMFGRHTNDSGLQDIDACLHLGEPVLV